MSAAQVDIPRRDRHANNNDDRPRGRRGGDSYRPGGAGPPKARSPPPPPKTEAEKQAIAKAEYEKLLDMRSGGTYIPPARLRALQAQITDTSSKEYQRMAWEALKKSINGLINKVNTANIKHIVPELFGENLVRGRGLFCRSIMKAQAASLPFTPIYAAMAAIVNTKLPQVGELLVKRLVMQLRKGFKRNDKAVCVASTTFLAQLINQQVQHEMLAGQILLLLLNKPTDDSVEIAVGFCREVGEYLEQMEPSISMIVFDQFRNILHEADIDKRTQYMVEVLFQVRKDKFKDNPAVREELDLVEEEDQITHQVELDGEINIQDSLNIYKFDPRWEENEAAYKKLKAEILGEGSSDEDDESGQDDDDSSDEEDEDTKAMEIKDQSNTDLVNLRRTIYLTIMSSADPEEAVHKLMKVNLPVGQEAELPSMIVECCSQEKTYTKFFGLMGERFARINRLWCDLFEQSFAKYYETIHRYENNKLRNIAQLFGHMFGVNALGWHCFSVIHLNEEETTSSSRIFVKILFQSMVEEMGLPSLKQKMADVELKSQLEGIFPRDNPRNLRFSINYFTSIGMGALTEEMRTYLQSMPKPALPAPVAGGGAADSDSESVSSYSSYSSGSDSRGGSRTPPRGADERGRSSSRRPPRGQRGRSYSSRSRSGSSRSTGSSLSRGRKASRRRRADSQSVSRSRSRGGYSRSRSYSSYSRTPSGSRSRSRSRSPPPRGINSNSPRLSRHRPARGGPSLSPPRRRRNSSSASSRSRPRSSAAATKTSRRRRPSDSRSASPRPGKNRSFSRDRPGKNRSFSRDRPGKNRPSSRDRPGKNRSSSRDRFGGRGRRRSSSGGKPRKRPYSNESLSRSPPIKRGRRG